MPRSIAPLHPLPHSQQSRAEQLARELTEFAALRAANPNAALIHGSELLKKLRIEGPPLALATCLRHLGSILAEAGDPANGLTYVVESEQICKRIDNQPGVVAALAVQATCLTAQGLFQRALRNTLLAMRLAREANLREDVARVSGGLGNLYKVTGKLDLAVLTYRSGMRLASRLKLRDCFVANLNNVAMCEIERGNPRYALLLAQRALRFCAKPKPVTAIRGYLLHTVGLALVACGRLEEARAVLLEAYAVARTRSLTSVERKCALELGRIGVATQDLGLAREYLDLAQYGAINAEDRRAILEIALLQAQVEADNPEAAQAWIARSQLALKALDQALATQRRDALELERELETIRDEAEQGRLKQVELTARLTATQRRAQELAIAANSDALTGLRNRRALAEYVEAVIDKPNHEPYAVLMFDIDRFKAINDAFGHPVGDHALSLLASSVRLVLRAGDEFFRYGGDEFLVIATGRGARNGAHLAEEITRVARGLAPSHIDPVSISVSVGVAYVPAVAQVSWAHVMQRVDAALLRAKAQGRSRVVVERITPASLLPDQ
jgi:diguanylate cyclase (GGDEF)-like protein